MTTMIRFTLFTALVLAAWFVASVSHVHAMATITTIVNQLAAAR